MIEMFNLAAEDAVLGCLLSGLDDDNVTAGLTASMFSNEQHQKIFIAVRRLERDKQGVDVITAAELLNKHNHLEAVGGIAYLVGLVTNCTGSGNLARYAEIIREKFQQRKLHLTLHSALKNIEVGKDIQNTISQSIDALNGILDGSLRSEPTRISELLSDRFDRIDKLQQGELKPIGTKFEQFDEKFGGFNGGDLIILAGRPSMGKTALGVQIAEQIQTAEKSALIFSCEMSNGQLIDRVIAGNSRISSKRLFREAAMHEEDWDRLMASVPKLQDMNIYLDDTAVTLDDMAVKARAVKRKHGLGLIVIDYLQLMSGNERLTNREQEISAISRGLKKMAKDLDVPVIALSQLSRKVEERQDKRPIMSDLRESGAIEQDADMILFVYRDDYYNPDSAHKGTAEIINAKNRNGDTGKIFLTFEREHTRFTSHIGAEPVYERPRNAYEDL